MVMALALCIVFVQEVVCHQVMFLIIQIVMIVMRTLIPGKLLILQLIAAMAVLIMIVMAQMINFISMRLM
jgi:hypothetical protein